MAFPPEFSSTESYANRYDLFTLALPGGGTQYYNTRQFKSFPITKSLFLYQRSKRSKDEKQFSQTSEPRGYQVKGFLEHHNIAHSKKRSYLL